MAMYVYSLPVISTLLFDGRKGEEGGEDGQIITKNTHTLLISDKKSSLHVYLTCLVLCDHYLCSSWSEGSFNSYVACVATRSETDEKS